MEDFRGRVLLLDPYARGKLFILAGGLIAFEGAEQTSIILDVGVDGAGQPVRINVVGVQLVEVLVLRVVEEDRG